MLKKKQIKFYVSIEIRLVNLSRNKSIIFTFSAVVVLFQQRHISSKTLRFFKQNGLFFAIGLVIV